MVATILGVIERLSHGVQPDVNYNKHVPHHKGQDDTLVLTVGHAHTWMWSQNTGSTSQEFSLCPLSL